MDSEPEVTTDSREELVDIVDEHNEVVEVTTRARMRTEKLPHRASYIALCDRQGRYLVEIRTLCKDYAPGKFDACVGGIMQHGEEEVESARRELLEELGIDAADAAAQVEFTPLGVQQVMYADGVHFLMAYLYFARADCITVRQKSEVSGLMYLTREELLALSHDCTYDSVQVFREIISRAEDLGLNPP
ncbi:MAG: NUDIX domain-containing protein [Succinivibrio sp.]|nr:NUDIX domain-containing protein [Succinivibrio sp.]